MIIGIAGPTASGKTTIAQMLTKRFGAYCTRYSLILAEIAKQQGLPTDKATLQKIYADERKIRGDDFLSRMLEKIIAGVNTDLIVIEGNRKISDITLLERLNDLEKLRELKKTDLRLLFVDASVEVRFRRYYKRQAGIGEKPVSFRAFLDLENHVCEDEIIMLRDIISKKGHVLKTDDLSIEEMLRQAVELLGVYDV